MLRSGAVPDSVKLLAFAGARDVIGAAEVLYPLSAGTTAGALLAAVCARWPALAPWKAALRVAVNGTYAADEDPVQPGDEVALIPPVAGG